MLRVIRIVFGFTASFIVMLGFNGCSTSLNNNFDCPNRAGVSCKSLDQINGMVDQGQIGGGGLSSLNDARISGDSEFDPYRGGKVLYQRNPLRYGEQVQRIWVAPYEDMEGNYHDQHLIYSVVKPGFWIGRPVKEVKED